MELRQYLAILRRRWWLLVLLALIGGGAAFAAGELRQPIYVATTTILINQAPGALPDYTAVQQGQRVATTYVELLQKRPVLEQVIANLGLQTSPEALDAKINVIPVRDTNLLELTVQDTDPQRAADIANEVVRVFIAQNLEFQESRFADSLRNLQSEMDKVQAEIDRVEARLEVLEKSTTALTPEQQAERNHLQQLLANYQSSYATLLDRYEQVRLAQAQATDKVSVVEDALPGKRAGQSSSMLAVQGALVGMLLGIGLVVLLEYFNDTVKSEEEAEALTGLPTLGQIGNIEKVDEPQDVLVTILYPRSPVAEAYRVFRANLEFLAVDGPIRSVVVTSTGPVEGKTTTAANLAIALAQAGKRVILVDADLRRPAMHRLFGCSNSVGVSTALLQEPSNNIARHLVRTEVENLLLMPSGPLPPNPAELLGSKRAADLVRQLSELADVVILDSPPVLAVADPVLLARYCDAALLVILTEKTQAEALRRAKEQLEQSGVPHMGVVLNRVPLSSDGYYYRYRHYYSDHEEV